MKLGGGATTSSGNMNFLDDTATATMVIGGWTDSSDILEIKTDSSDIVTLTHMGFPIASVDVGETTIKVKFLLEISFNPGEYIKISGLNDQSSPPHTGTKVTGSMISGVTGDTSGIFNADDTSVTIDLGGLLFDDGGEITINLGYEMTSGNDGWTENSDIQDSIDEVNTAINTLRSQAKNLSNDLGTITTRQKFTSELINTLSDGADNLTLADINQEGANMLMLQTRQSLSTTSLSLSSQAASSILRLF